MEITNLRVSEVVLRFNLNGDSYEGKAVLVSGPRSVREESTPLSGGVTKSGWPAKGKWKEMVVEKDKKERKYSQPGRRTWKIARLRASGASAAEIAKDSKYPKHVVYSAIACIKRRLKASGSERGLGLGSDGELVLESGA